MKYDKIIIFLEICVEKWYFSYVSSIWEYGSGAVCTRPMKHSVAGKGEGYEGKSSREIQKQKSDGQDFHCKLSAFGDLSVDYGNNQCCAGEQVFKEKH